MAHVDGGAGSMLGAGGAIIGGGGMGPGAATAATRRRRGGNRVQHLHLVPGGSVDVARLKALIAAPKPVRDYSFNHVTTRTEESLVSTSYLWATTEDKSYKGPARGLESPREKPYRCNGVPDLVLSSLNHVRARARVAEQRQERREADKAGGKQRLSSSRRRKRRAEADVPTASGFAPRAVRPFFPQSMAGARQQGVAALKSQVTPRAVYHVRPRHTKVLLGQFGKANGFAALKADLAKSNARVKAMRSGNVSLFHLGDVSPKHMNAVKIGDNSAECIASPTRATRAAARARASAAAKSAFRGGGSGGKTEDGRHVPRPPSGRASSRRSSRPVTGRTVTSKSSAVTAQVPRLDLSRVDSHNSMGGVPLTPIPRDGAPPRGPADHAESYRELAEEVMDKFLRFVQKYTGEGDELSDGGGVSGDGSGVVPMHVQFEEDGSGADGAVSVGGTTIDIAGGSVVMVEEGADDGTVSGTSQSSRPSSSNMFRVFTPAALRHVYKCYVVLMEELSASDFANAAFKHARDGGLLGLTFPGSKTAPPSRGSMRRADSMRSAAAAVTSTAPPSSWAEADALELKDHRPNGEVVCRTPSPEPYLPLSDRRAATPPTEWPSLTHRAKQAVRAKARLEARHTNEATRRDKLFRDFLGMDAPVVPPALMRHQHPWPAGGGSFALSHHNTSDMWASNSMRSSRAALRPSHGSSSRATNRQASAAGTVRHGGMAPHGSHSFWLGATTRGGATGGAGGPGGAGGGGGGGARSPLKLTRGVRATPDHAKALGVQGMVGLGDQFEVEKSVLSSEFDKLLQSLHDNHDDNMRYKFRAFTEVLNERLSIPASQQVKGVRILAELFRVRELRSRMEGTEWYDNLLTLVSQTSTRDGVNASERYALKLVLEVLQAGNPFGRDSLEAIATTLTSEEHEMVGVQRILAYLRRLLQVDLESWDEFLRAQGRPQSLESCAQELYSEEARHFQWLRVGLGPPARSRKSNKRAGGKDKGDLVRQASPIRNVTTAPSVAPTVTTQVTHATEFTEATSTAPTPSSTKLQIDERT